jgi:serine acetyltransferase
MQVLQRRTPAWAIGQKPPVGVRAVVTKSFPARSVLIGVPAKPMKSS